MVKTASKQCNTIGKKLASHKDSVDLFMRHDPILRHGAIYQIPCHDCDLYDIDETKCSFSMRKKEHLPDIRHLRFDKSALSHYIRMFLTTNIPWIGPTLNFLTSNLTSQNAGLSSHISLTKGAFRLDAKQREASKQRDLRQPSRVVANLRDWSLHRLILITYF